MESDGPVSAVPEDLGSSSADELERVALPEPVVAGRAELARFGLGAEPAIVVDPSSQTLYVASAQAVIAEYPVSTGASGLSSTWDSGGTPTGAMRVAGVVDGEWGEVFKFARPTGKLAQVSDAVWGAAFMTTRLVLLEGAEASNASTRSRGIYIHGTNLEGSLGRPMSAGCVRMGNDDIVELAGLVTDGMWMFVLDRPYAS